MDFFIENQFWFLLAGLVVIPLIAFVLITLLNRKKHTIMECVLMSIAIVYVYDMFLLGLSLFYILSGTGSEFIVMLPISLIPVLIAVIVGLVYRKQFGWGKIASRMLSFNVVYLVAGIYFLALGMGVGYGIGWLCLLGLIPVVLGVTLYFVLGRRYVVVVTPDEEYVFLESEYSKKEVYDYINHLTM